MHVQVRHASHRQVDACHQVLLFDLQSHLLGWSRLANCNQAAGVERGELIAGRGDDPLDRFGKTAGADGSPVVVPEADTAAHEVVGDLQIIVVRAIEVREVDGRRVISFGTSSYGYDIRCAPEFKVFTNIHSTVVDPKNFDEKSFVDIEADVCIIPPNSFALARTVEYFRIPRNVLTICLGKSTYARCGIIVNVTPFEPEWEGYVTLEFSNTTPLPAKIYAGEGCAQVLFFESDEICETS